MCNICKKPSCNSCNSCSTPNTLNNSYYTTINAIIDADINIPCLNITKTKINNKITFTGVWDAACLAALTCPLCNNTPPGPCSCNVPTGLGITFDGRGLNDVSKYRARIIWQAVVGATGYTVEYKLSTDSVWTVLSANQIATNNSSLILTANANNSLYYDFRVKAICAGVNCFSNYISVNNKELVRCVAPTGSSWNAETLVLSWFGAPNQASSFKIEMRRDDEANFTTIIVPVIENPAGSGHYFADFSTYPFTPDYVYHFCVSNTCGSTDDIISDHGTGCAFDCIVPAQTAPIVSSITSTSALVTWTNIYGVNAHTITIFNNTTNTLVLPQTNVGFVSSYTATGLLPNNNYTITVGYVCGAYSGCIGKKVTFTTGNITSCSPPINITIL